MEIDKKRIGYCRNAARGVLKKYEKKRGPVKPPVPVEDIAKWAGFEIEIDDGMDDAHSALLLIEFKVIQVNSNHHVHRRRFSIGHELGHFYLAHPPETECDEEEIELYNKEANEFSAELLVPLHLLKESLKQAKEILALSKIFLVSPATLTIKISSQHKLYDL